MGTTLRTVVEEIGGGVPNGKQFKAAQTGGPSGGCIPAGLIDTPIDYESLGAIGSMMGSGGLIVMDEDNCMVDIAKFFLEFTVDESCGKCTPCRVGTKRLYEMLDKITQGRGTLTDLDKMEELCHYIKDQLKTPSAGWDRPPRTRCSRPCGISATSTKRMSCRRPARQGSARSW